MADRRAGRGAVHRSADVIALWLVLAVAAGGVSGFVLGCRQVHRMIARMSPEQVDRLGDRVAKLKGLRDGAS
jgi:hypothetical protein